MTQPELAASTHLRHLLPGFLQGDTVACGGEETVRSDESTANSDVIFCGADHQAFVDLISLSFPFLVYKSELVAVASEDARECEIEARCGTHL